MILILWAGFWLFFNLGSFFGEMPTEGVGAAVNHLTVALITLALFIIAWRWELAGALMLAVAASLAVYFFHLYELRRPSDIFVLLTLPLPMVAAAVLLATRWRLLRAVARSGAAGE